MIGRVHVSEINSFLKHFVAAFKKGISDSCRFGSAAGSISECTSCRTAFNISGNIEGLIAVEYFHEEKTGSVGNSCLKNICIGQIFRFYSDISEGTSSAGYKVEASKNSDIDKMIYDIRKLEPVMSIRIQSSAITVELYVLKITQNCITC